MKRLHYIALIITLCFSNALTGQEFIQMTKSKSGVYTIPCEVNGLKLRFIFDTGASDVHLSAGQATYMFDNGYLSEDDVVGSAKYKMADGSVAENTVITLKTVKIGNTVLKNVKASVSKKQDAQLLLGQSALNRLGGFSIKDDYLIIGGWNNNTSRDSDTYKGKPNATKKREGEGTFYYANGEKYVGHWKDGKKDGFGKETFKGGRYKGYYKNNKRNGEGTMYYNNGDRYVGHWKDSRKNGEGTYYFASGQKYTGHWKDSKKDGFGKETYPSGARYEGYYKNDKRNGEGTFYYANGEKYVGHWKDGKKNGEGTYYYANGQKYVGLWKNNKKDGRGTYYYTNGTKRDMVFQDGTRIKD